MTIIIISGGSILSNLHVLVHLISIKFYSLGSTIISNLKVRRTKHVEVKTFALSCTATSRWQRMNVNSGSVTEAKRILRSKSPKCQLQRRSLVKKGQNVLLILKFDDHWYIIKNIVNSFFWRGLGGGGHGNLGARTRQKSHRIGWGLRLCTLTKSEFKRRGETSNRGLEVAQA